MTALVSCTRRLRPNLAPDTRAPTMPIYPGHVLHVLACNRKRPFMPRTCFSCRVCFQPRCAHRNVQLWLQNMVQDFERRSGRVLGIGLVCFGCMAQRRWELMVACWRCCSITAVCSWMTILRSIKVVFNERLSVKTWSSSAHGSCLGTLAAYSDSLKLIGARVRIC